MPPVPLALNAHAPDAHPGNTRGLDGNAAVELPVRCEHTSPIPPVPSGETIS